MAESIKGGLSLSERLSSRNPAVREEAQRETSQQPNFSSISGESVYVPPPSKSSTSSGGGGLTGTAFDPKQALGQKAPPTRVVSSREPTQTPAQPTSTLQRLSSSEKAEYQRLSSKLQDERYLTIEEGKRLEKLEYERLSPTQKIKYGFGEKGLNIWGGVKSYATAYGFGAVGKGVTAGTVKLASGGRQIAKAGLKSVLPKALTTGKVGGFISFAGATTEVGLAAKGGAKATKKVSELRSTPEEQLAIQSKNFKQAMQKGFQAEQESFGSKTIQIPTTEKQVQIPTLKGIAQSIPLVPLFAGKESEFKSAVREEFKAQGYTGKKLDAAVSGAVKQRKAGLIGEGVGVFGANVYSEVFGQQLVGRAFQKAGSTTLKKAPSTLFKKTGFQIGKAGFGEGVASELAMQEGRFEPFSAKKVGLAGAFGFGTAGLIGGSIAGLRINRPTVSRAIEYGAYITDPFEKPADITAAKTIKSLRLPVSTPAIVMPKSPTVTLTTTPTQTKTPTSVKTALNVLAPTKTKTTVPTKIGTTTTVPITPKIPIQIQPEVPIQVPVNIPVNIPTSVPVNIPTPVSRMVIPPPIPLAFPSGSGKGKGVGRGVKFVNELAIGQKLLAKSMGFKTAAKPRPRSTKRKGKKRVATKKRKGGFGFTFQRLNFGF